MRTPLAETGAAGKKPPAFRIPIRVGTNDDASSHSPTHTQKGGPEMSRLGLRAAMSRKVRFLAIVGGVLLAGMGTLYAAAGHTAHVKLGLAATSAAPTARGKSRLTVADGRKRMPAWASASMLVSL